jgi:hypothetical protein
MNTYNTTILQQIKGPQRTYIANILKETKDSELRSPNGMLNYACGHSPPGLPPHNVTVKVQHLFSHRQLYTALSRIWVQQYVIVCLNMDETVTKNIMYKELLL